MTDLPELLKAAYAEGSKRALMDAGYDEKTAENMSEDITKEMTPTVPNQFNPVIGLGEKPTEKKSTQIKEAVSRALARKALESSQLSRTVKPKTLKEGIKGLRSTGKATRTLERAGEDAIPKAWEKTVAQYMRSSPKARGLSKKKFLEEAKKQLAQGTKYKGPLGRKG